MKNYRTIKLNSLNSLIFYNENRQYSVWFHCWLRSFPLVPSYIICKFFYFYINWENKFYQIIKPLVICRHVGLCRQAKEVRWEAYYSIWLWEGSTELPNDYGNVGEGRKKEPFTQVDTGVISWPKEEVARHRAHSYQMLHITDSNCCCLFSVVSVTAETTD